MGLNPFDIELQREAIDDHKANRMSDPWKRGAYFSIDQERCVKYWIEQIGDAEMYEQRWHELQEEQECS